MPLHALHCTKKITHLPPQAGFRAAAGRPRPRHTVETVSFGLILTQDALSNGACGAPTRTVKGVWVKGTEDRQPIQAQRRATRPLGLAPSASHETLWFFAKKEYSLKCRPNAPDGSPPGCHHASSRACHSAPHCGHLHSVAAPHQDLHVTKHDKPLGSGGRLNRVIVTR